MDRTKDIIKKINAMSGSKSPYEVFSDWIKCTGVVIIQRNDAYKPVAVPGITFIMER